MNNIVKTVKYNNLIINVMYDEYATSPREWCNLGTIVGYHGRYNLVDVDNPASGEHGSYYADFLAYLRNDSLSIRDVIYLPVYAYIHSGLSLSTAPFSCSWDSGQVGYIYVPKSEVRQEFSTKRVSQKLFNKVEDILASEIKIFSQYLGGEIYAFEILDLGGNHVDSCCGFYSIEDAISHAKECLPVAA